MPIYESICTKCGTRHEYVSTISRCSDTPKCCGKKTEKRIFTAPIGQFDIQPWESYISPASGKLITSKTERREDMRATGCRQWEGMKDEKAHASRLKQEEEKKEDEKLDKEVRKAWANLDPAKKEVALKAVD